jgi:hypothetical protein
MSCRFLTVGYRWLSRKNGSRYVTYGSGKNTPKITIQGDYLKDNGFDIGTKISVSLNANQIIITKQ